MRHHNAKWGGYARNLPTIEKPPASTREEKEREGG